MAKMVADHQATIELFEAEARDGKDDALRKWAAEKLPRFAAISRRRARISMPREVTQRAPEAACENLGPSFGSRR